MYKYIGNEHGNDGDRNMNKYFEGGGALCGGEITRRGPDTGQGGDTRTHAS